MNPRVPFCQPEAGQENHHGSVIQNSFNQGILTLVGCEYPGYNWVFREMSHLLIVNSRYRVRVLKLSFPKRIVPGTVVPHLSSYPH